MIDKIILVISTICIWVFFPPVIVGIDASDVTSSHNFVMENIWERDRNVFWSERTIAL